MNITSDQLTQTRRYVPAMNRTPDNGYRQRRIDRVRPEGEEVERSVRRPSPSVLRKWLSRVDGRFMGTPFDIHPHDAILWAMRVSAGEVAYCDSQIARLEEDELFERPTHTEWGEMPSGRIEEIVIKQDAETMSRWVMWRNQAMKNMAQYAKMALDVGIEERQIQLAEQQAQQLVTVISAVLTDLGHDLKDVRTREVVRKRLMEGAIEGQATPLQVTVAQDSDNETEAA